MLNTSLSTVVIMLKVGAKVFIRLQIFKQTRNISMLRFGEDLTVLITEGVGSPRFDNLSTNSREFGLRE